MIQLAPSQIKTLKDRFIPDQPGPLVALHVIQTGHGTCLVDRWPDPRAILMETAGNYSLSGDPDALEPEDLRPHITGFVAAPEKFLPLLQTTFPTLTIWDRVILELQGEPHLSRPQTGLVRRLEAEDAGQLEALSPESRWISKTWESQTNLASSGYGWGAFIEGRLVSVACTFFVGDRYEELGVATEPEFRGMGLSVACAGALCAAIRERGRWSSWTTSTDNLASLRVAEKLGFTVHHFDQLYVVGIQPPPPPQRDQEDPA